MFGKIVKGYRALRSRAPDTMHTPLFCCRQGKTYRSTGDKNPQRFRLISSSVAPRRGGLGNPAPDAYQPALLADDPMVEQIASVNPMEDRFSPSLGELTLTVSAAAQ